MTAWIRRPPVGALYITPLPHWIRKGLIRQTLTCLVIWICLGLMCGGVKLNAPTVAWAAGKQTGQQVLDKARKTFESMKSFQADLTEVFQWNLAETTTETHGKMSYRNDNRFRLDFPNQRLIVDGKTLYRYNSDNNQLLIEPYTDDSGVILPKQLLSGLSTHWNLTDGSNTALEDSLGYQLHLQAKDQDSAFRFVTVWIQPDNWFVSKAIVDDIQGNRTMYRIDQVVVNPMLPDSLFQAKVPVGTETIDLR